MPSEPEKIMTHSNSHEIVRCDISGVVRSRMVVVEGDITRLSVDAIVNAAT